MMLRITHLLRMTTIAATLSPSTASLSAQYSRLTLFPAKGPQQVKLPYTYKHLSNDEVQKTIWVPERFYTTLVPGGRYTHAVVGHLSPCILVALKNNINNRVVVFHKSYANSIENLISIATKELGITDSSQISGILFTNENPEFETECHEIIDGPKSFKDLCNGKTQREELRFVKDSLNKAFAITDSTQINAYIYTGNTTGGFGDYEFAPLSVLIDGNLTFNSICMMHEHVLGNFDNYTLEERIKVFGITYLKMLIQVTKDRFPDIYEKTSNIYNNSHFAKIE